MRLQLVIISTVPNPLRYLNGVTAVVAVTDLEVSRSWYETLFGPVTVIPDESIISWKIAHNSWLQVTESPEFAGNSIAVVGTTDLTKQLQLCDDLGIPVGTVQDWGFARAALASDPDGNRIQFVELGPGISW